MHQRRMLDQRIEGVRSPVAADEKTLRMCDSERDAVLVSIQLSGLTQSVIASRCGVSQQAVGKWSRKGVPHKRVKAFCNVTGTNLLAQYIELNRVMRELTGRVRELDRITSITEHARRNTA